MHPLWAGRETACEIPVSLAAETEGAAWSRRCGDKMADNPSAWILRTVHGAELSTIWIGMCVEINLCSSMLLRRECDCYHGIHLMILTDINALDLQEIVRLCQHSICEE